MSARNFFRRNVLSMFLGAVFVTSAAQMLMDHGAPNSLPPKDKIGVKTSENDFEGLLAGFKKDFPDAYKKVKGSLNAHLLMTSPLFDARNQYSVDNVKQLDSIFDATTSDNVVETTVAALEVFEGLERRAYNDGFGYQTIGVGIRLYKNPNDPRSKLIRRHLHKGQSYGAIYSGKAALSTEQARAITVASLKEDGGYFDVLENAVQEAVLAAPDPSAEENALLHEGNMKPAYKAMLATMIFQCPDVLSRNPAKTYEHIRTLCNAGANAVAQRDAMHNLIDVYRSDKLLKTYEEKAFKTPRSNLAIRADCLANCTLGDVDGAQTEQTIAEKINAMRRDQHDRAVIVMVGNLPEGTDLATLLNNPACGWKKGGANKIYVPASGLCAVQKPEGFEINYAAKNKNSDFVLVSSLNGEVLAGSYKAQKQPRPML